MTQIPLPSAEDFDLVGPAFAQDPYPTYRRILETAPVHWNRSVGGWFMGRYADVSAGLRDARLSANRFAPLLRQLPPAMLERLATIARISSKWTVTMDPPEHTRLRSLTSVAFVPRVVDALRPQITALAQGFVDAVRPAGEMDLVRDVASPLPAAVMALVIGVPFEQRERFAVAAAALARFFAVSALSDELIAETTRSLEEIERYLQEIVDERRRAPRPDVISHLLAVRQGDGASAALTDEEIVAECILLMVAGQESTVHAISSGVLALLEHPAELARLRADPSLLRSAVEEILRYTGPFQRLGRVALEPFEIEGQHIQVGDLVWLGVAAANRDPAQFPDPDRFDITRADNHHLAFGYGVHFCEGAALARLEIQSALEVLLERLPHLRLAVPPHTLRWVEGTSMHSLVSLPVHF